MRPVAIVWQIGDRGNILVETAKTILLAKDLSYLLHVLVFNKHGVLSLRVYILAKC